MEKLLNEKNLEIDKLKRENSESIRKYKNAAVLQIQDLMEKLIDKDNQIEVKPALLKFIRTFILENFRFLLVNF